jgi:hypothetical protein
MKKDGCLWKEIIAAFPHRSKGTIQVRYSTIQRCADGSMFNASTTPKEDKTLLKVRNKGC